MAAPDFYFAVNEIFRHINDHYGKAVLIDYWRSLGREYYRRRNSQWREKGLAAVAADWQAYFAQEPGAEVEVHQIAEAVELEVRTCPAIAHLRQHGRDIVPYFCEHCDHVCGAQAEAGGFRFERAGGMGSCRQRFVQLTTQGAP